MQIGDRYKLKMRPEMIYTITGVFHTVSVHGPGECLIEAVYEDTKNAPGIVQHLPRKVAKDKFLAATTLIYSVAQPSQPVQGLGGGQLDAVAAAFRAQFNEAIKGQNTFKTPVIRSACDCGGHKVGYKDYTRMHSTWCKVYKGE